MVDVRHARRWPGARPVVRPRPRHDLPGGSVLARDRPVPELSGSRRGVARRGGHPRQSRPRDPGTRLGGVEMRCARNSAARARTSSAAGATGCPRDTRPSAPGICGAGLCGCACEPGGDGPVARWPSPAMSADRLSEQAAAGDDVVAVAGGHGDVRQRRDATGADRGRQRAGPSRPRRGLGLRCLAWLAKPQVADGAPAADRQRRLVAPRWTPAQVRPAADRGGLPARGGRGRSRASHGRRLVGPSSLPWRSRGSWATTIAGNHSRTSQMAAAGTASVRSSIE